MKKPLTAKQLFKEGEKRKTIRRKSIEGKLLPIIKLHLKAESTKEDVIYVLSKIINELTI